MPLRVEYRKPADTKNNPIGTELTKVIGGTVAGKGFLEIVKRILRKFLDGGREEAEKEIETIIRILELILQIIEALDQLKE